MRITVFAGVAASIALAVGGLVGVGDAAETTNSSGPVRTVSVEGVALVPIDGRASAGTADGTYRKALAEAVADGQSKAQLLAEKTGSSVGAIQTVTEGSGSIECLEGEYEGVLPDFGQGGAALVTPDAASVSPSRPVAKHKVAKHKSSRGGARGRRRQAEKADVAGCTLSAHVGLVYQLG